MHFFLQVSIKEGTLDIKLTYLPASLGNQCNHHPSCFLPRNRWKNLLLMYAMPLDEPFCNWPIPSPLNGSITIEFSFVYPLWSCYFLFVGNFNKLPSFITFNCINSFVHSLHPNITFTCFMKRGRFYFYSCHWGIINKFAQGLFHSQQRVEPFSS